MFLLCYHSLCEFWWSVWSPLGQISVQGMHILILFSSTSILLLGQALTQELWSTTKLSITPHTKAEQNGQTAACPWTNSKQSLWKRPLTFCNGREETSILRQKPLTHPHERTGDPDCGVCAWKEPISGGDCAAWHPSPERRKGSRRAR